MRALFSSVLLAMVGVLGLAEEENAGEKTPFVRGGIDDKPFIARVGRTSIGGYLEMHFRHERTDGVTEETTFLPQRFNVFTFTPVSERVRVASELEFEEGGEEIKIELAVVDFEIHSAVHFRAGMLLSPLGKFNLAHDGPANDLTDRPLVNTEIVGTALSEPGMGLFGAIYPSASSRVTYEIYAVNGFHDGVVGGDGARTRLPAGKGTVEDNNNTPAWVGRVALMPTPALEVGVSAHLGPYNAWLIDDLGVDRRRMAKVFVLDGEARLGRLELLGEAVAAQVELSEGLRGLFAERQRGYYVQASFHFGRGLFSRLPESVFTLAVRQEAVDFDTNVEGDSIGQLTVGLNFRPTEETAFKLDYVRGRERDRFNNPSETAAVLFSVASYF